MISSISVCSIRLSHEPNVKSIDARKVVQVLISNDACTMPHLESEVQVQKNMPQEQASQLAQTPETFWLGIR